MKNHLLIPLAVLGLTLVSLSAQPRTPVPEPAKPQDELPVQLDPASPLDSLERQLVDASFEQRGDLATAFESASLSVGRQIAELKARGLKLDDAASGNLEEARSFGAQVFRDLSLSTEETWRTSRHNALMALRKIRGTLETVQRTASTDSDRA